MLEAAETAWVLICECGALIEALPYTGRYRSKEGGGGSGDGGDTGGGGGGGIAIILIFTVVM